MCKVWVQIQSDQGKSFDIEILDHLCAMFTGVEHFRGEGPLRDPLTRTHASLPQGLGGGRLPPDSPKNQLPSAKLI